MIESITQKVNRTKKQTVTKGMERYIVSEENDHDLDLKTDDRLKPALVPPFQPVKVKLHIGIVLVLEGDREIFLGVGPNLSVCFSIVGGEWDSEINSEVAQLRASLLVPGR